jgi:acetyl-CoA carboxylase biotin carboxylase subunit
MREPDFVEGRLSIRYLEDHPQLQNGKRDAGEMKLAAVAAALLEEEKTKRGSMKRIERGRRGGAWRDRGWRQSE